MTAVIQALTVMILGLAAVYFFGLVFLGMRFSRAQRSTLAFQTKVRYERPAAAIDVVGADASALDRYHVYYLIPCLNEALVIGETVARLPMHGNSTVIVVDDASDDRTWQTAREVTQADLVVVRRRLPDARLGKGPALNAGYDALLRLVETRGEDPEQVIVCVMDADGRLSEGALAVTLPLFDDAAVGGAQLAVRIRNRHKWVTRFQNFQFWTLAAVTQWGRVATGTVSLGGNGQFTRLSALQTIGVHPWNPSLTEDLDLAVSLIARGWRLTTTPFASVDQQGVESVRRLLNQRTRWYQGHMMAAARIPEIWRSTKINHASAVEAILYLLVPWVLDLPWSILYHIALVRLLVNLAAFGLSGGPDAILGWALFYIVAFYPALVSCIICKRREPEMTWRGAFVFGHSFLLMNYMSWSCSWRALYRIVRRRNGWAKTERQVDRATVGRAPVAAVAE